MNLKPIKIVLVGDGGTGKTSFVSRISTETFKDSYTATLGYELTRAQVQTSRGNIQLEFWDTAGQEKAGPLRDKYYEGSDAAIIFFDVTSRVTYKNVPTWHRDLTRVCSETLPMVLFANKVDVLERKVKSKSINYHSKHPNVSLVEGSVKENTNLKESLEIILRIILKDPSLDIVHLDTLVLALDGINLDKDPYEAHSQSAHEECDVEDWQQLFS